MRKWLGTLLVILIVTLIFPYYLSIIDVTAKEKVNQQTRILSDLTEHTAIVISSDQEFEDQADIESWQGNGSESNPYIIENYNLTINGTAITIIDTSVYFVIQTCLIVCTNSTFTSLDYYNNFCMVWGNVTNGAVIDCEIYSVRNGLGMQDVNESRIDGCTFGLEMTNFRHAIDLTNTDYCEITDNTINTVGPVDRAISLDNVHHIVITLNQLMGYGYGVYGDSSNYCTLETNNFVNCMNAAVELNGNHTVVINNTGDGGAYGLRFSDCVNITAQDNSLASGGIGLEGEKIEYWISHTIQDNQVNGRPILYLPGANYQTINVSSFAEVILTNCVGCTFYGGSFTDSTYGFLGGFLTDCSFENNTGDNNKAFFISLTNSEGCNFTNNEAGQSINAAIILIYSTGCTVVGNTAIHSGIVFYNSQDCIVDSNIVKRSSTGIWLGYSDFCNITRNHIEDNGGGVYLWDSHNNTLKDNNVFLNNAYGFSIDYSRSNHLTGNRIHDNNNVGIDFGSSSSNNTIINNTIWNNAGHNAVDDGSSNQWDDGVAFGNMWGDFDGIGYYYIPGTAGAVDHYPLEAPEISTTTSSTSLVTTSTTNTVSTTSSPSTTSTTSTTPTEPTTPPSYPYELIFIIVTIAAIALIGIIGLFAFKVIRNRRG